MMKIIVITLFLLVSGIVKAQDLIDSLASKSCDCVKDLDFANIPQEEMNMKVGTCLIQVSMPYKDKLNKDYDVNLDDLNQETGVKLGKLLVVRMLTICPETIGQLGKARNASKSAKLVINGQIQDIIENEFVTITVLDEEKKIVSKFIWLKNFPGSNDLTLQKKAKGKKVSISYEVNEFYDPRIKDYRIYNVITSMEFREN